MLFQCPTQAMCVDMLRVIGVGECVTLVVSTIPFPVSVYEIKEIVKKVNIDKCTVAKNMVFVKGTLEKDITYKTMDKDRCYDLDRENKEGRSERLVCGELRHCHFFAPFECCIEVSGALPGDSCKVECTSVEGEVDEPLRYRLDGTFRKLLEKTCIRIVVKVRRETEITITPTNPSLCPTLKKGLGFTLTNLQANLGASVLSKGWLAKGWLAK